MPPAESISDNVNFDLRVYRGADRSWKLISFAVVLATAIGLAIEFSVLALDGIPSLKRGGLTTVGGQVFVLALALGTLCVGFLLLVVLPKQLSGAVELSVDDAGVSLTYPRGGKDHYLWRGRGGRFVLLDWSAYPEVTSRGLTYAIVGSSIWARRSLISREAFDAILRRAHAKELSVTTRTGSAALYGQAPLIYTVR